MLDVAFETPYRQSLAARKMPDTFRDTYRQLHLGIRDHPTDSQFWVLTRKGARLLDNLKRPCFPQTFRPGWKALPSMVRPSPTKTEAPQVTAKRPKASATGSCDVPQV